jgi:hypothetical protein
VVLDCEDVRALADFYRELCDLAYPPGHDEVEPGEDWLNLRNPGGVELAFQQVDRLTRSTWPEGDVPQQLHLDMSVPDFASLQEQRDRAVALGAEVRYDRSADAEEPLYVFADPAGHPFCIFVSAT